MKAADLVKLNGKRKGKKSKTPELTDKDTKEQLDVKPDQTFKEPTGVPVVFKRPSDSANGESADSGTKKKARFSPPPIECPEPNCGKRYSHKNGLKYHQAHAHQNKADAEETKPAVSHSQWEGLHISHMFGILWNNYSTPVASQFMASAIFEVFSFENKVP